MCIRDRIQSGLYCFSSQLQNLLTCRNPSSPSSLLSLYRELCGYVHRHSCLRTVSYTHLCRQYIQCSCLTAPQQNHQGQHLSLIHISVVFGNEKQTYAMLNARANQVAHKLRRLGVGPDAFVVLVAERGIEMLAGIYGIMKAGGAYVQMCIRDSCRICCSKE